MGVYYIYKSSLPRRAAGVVLKNIFQYWQVCYNKRGLHVHCSLALSLSVPLPLPRHTHTHTHTYAHAHARTHCPSLCPLLILTYTQMLSRDRAVPVRHPRCHSPSDLEIGLRKRPCVPLSPCVSANEQRQARSGSPG